jgi:hypothetical protein
MHSTVSRLGVVAIQASKGRYVSKLKRKARLDLTQNLPNPGDVFYKMFVIVISPRHDLNLSQAQALGQKHEEPS